MSQKNFLLKTDQDLAALGVELEKVYGIRCLPTSNLERTFFDTFDWRLYRFGMAAALVHSDPVRSQWFHINLGGSIQTLDFPPPRFVSGIPNGTLRDELEPVLEMRALLPYARVSSESAVWEVLNADRKVVSRLHFEKLSVGPPDGPPVRMIPSRVWIAPLRGYEEVSEDLSQLLSFHVKLETAPDLVEEIAGAVEMKPGSYSSKLNIRLAPRMSARNAVHIILTDLFKTMMTNEWGVIQDLDPEFLHDFRVSVRRTRSVLGQLGDVLPPALMECFMPELKWLGQITGPTRDLDVYLMNYPGYLKSVPAEFREDLHPLKEFLAAHKKSEHQSMVCALGSLRYKKLKEDWRCFLAQDPDFGLPGERMEEKIILIASERIWKTFKKTIGKGAVITDDSPPSQFHQLRIACKKLRYLLEFFRSLYPEDAVSGCIDILKDLQDNLGAFNDLVVQIAALESFAEQMALEKDASPRTLMAMGILIQILLEKKLQVGSEFKSRFSKFDRARNRELFQKLFKQLRLEPAP